MAESRRTAILYFFEATDNELLHPHVGKILPIKVVIYKWWRPHSIERLFVLQVLRPARL
jgi:hypothetical protein